MVWNIITSPKRAQQKHEILNSSPDAMLKYLSSIGLEEYRSLAISLQIMLAWSVSMALFRRLKLMRIQWLPPILVL